MKRYKSKSCQMIVTLNPERSSTETFLFKVIDSECGSQDHTKQDLDNF